MSGDTRPALVGANLKKLRSLRGLTQFELADASGISRGTIAQLELGTRGVTHSTTIQRLADALGVPAAMFFADTAESTEGLR